MTESEPAPEFSRPIAVDAVDRRGVTRTIEASAEEREALARRFGLIAIDRLVATARLRSVNGGTAIRLDARFDADVVQPCVVTLEPVPATVGADFVLLYTREDDGTEVDVAYDDEVVEPLLGNRIDIGEAVAQELAIALDPYPRVPAADMAPLDEASDDRHEERSSQESAFAALARFRGARRGRDD